MGLRMGLARPANREVCRYFRGTTMKLGGGERGFEHLSS